MNERIKELIQEATGYVIRVYETNGVRTYGEREEVFDKEKFAELIVRECALAGLETHGSYYVHDDILKYFGFGVEE